MAFPQSWPSPDDWRITIVNTRDANLRVIDISFLPLLAPLAMRAELNKSGYAPLPTAVASQLASRSLYSANRIRMGYSVPDLSPVFRLMSYPYLHSSGSSRKASRTRIV